jgi:hypothetical protein
VSQISHEDHFDRASRRHHADAIYLQDDGRLPNADYHYGFAVECALKSLLLRFTHTTMKSTNPVKPSSARPVARRADGKSKRLGHLPELWVDVTALLHGRSGSILSSVLMGSEPFSDWSVDERYRDGGAIAEADVNRHRVAAVQILSLHQQALISGVLP